MKGIINFSTEHPISVIMLIITLVFLGVFCACIISIDFLPSFSEQKILVSTQFEGISAKDIRALLTIPLEDAFAALRGVKTMSSVSRDGLSLLTIQLHRGIDVDMALIDSRQIIDSVFHVLPSGSKKPLVEKIHSVQHETLVVAVTPKDQDLLYARHVVERDIKPRLQQLTGVSHVHISGGHKEQIAIEVAKDRIEARSLSLESIAHTISLSNFEYPAGTVQDGNKELLVKTAGLYSSMDDIGNTIVAFNDGGALHIRDIAQTSRTYQDQNSFFMHMGKEAIRISITKKTTVSPIKVSKQVQSELDTFSQLYADYYDFAIVSDMSAHMTKAVHTLLCAAVISLLVSTLVILLFLRSALVALILSSIIPVSMLLAIFVLCVFGKSLNLLTLSGMGIGIGMVVDCGVIVLESIQKKIVTTLKSNQANISHRKLVEIVCDASQSVCLSTFGSSITTIVVFIPIFFLNGLLADLFLDMALTIIVLILSSCLLSISLIPALCVLLLSKSNIAKMLQSENSQNHFFIQVEKCYQKALCFFLNHKISTVILVAICLLIGLLSIGQLEYQILATMQNNVVHLNVVFPQGTTVAYLRESATHINNTFLEQSFVSSIEILDGIEKDDYVQLSAYDAQDSKLHVTVKLNQTSSIDSVHAIQSLQNIFSAIGYTIHIESDKDILARFLDLEGDIYIAQAETDDLLWKKAKESVEKKDSILPQEIHTEWVFTPDRMSAARFNVSPLSLATLARQSIEGVYTVPFYEEGREIPLLVRYEDETIQSIEDIENVSVLIGDQRVPLRLLGSFTQEKTEKVLFRYNRKDAKVLTSIKPQVANSLISVRNLDLQELFGDSFLFLFLIVVLLYVVLGAQFESFSIPVFILIALPPAFSGSLFTLVLFDKVFSINAVIALIVLFGTSVNNAILLYEHYVHAQKLNHQVIIQMSSQKLRPILITTLTTVCALVPFSIDPYNIHAQSSLSLCLIGGLLFSAVLVLCVVPVIFLMILQRREMSI